MGFLGGRARVLHHKNLKSVYLQNLSRLKYFYVRQNLIRVLKLGLLIKAGDLT